MPTWDISLKDHAKKDPKEIKNGKKWPNQLVKNGKNWLETKNNIMKKCMKWEWKKEAISTKNSRN